VCASSLDVKAVVALCSVVHITLVAAGFSLHFVWSLGFLLLVGLFHGFVSSALFLVFSVHSYLFASRSIVIQGFVGGGV